MKKYILLIVTAFLLLPQACTEKHFITDEAYRADVESDFKSKQELLSKGDLFTVFKEQMTTEEMEAMKFLYAYMPVADITNNEGTFFLQNVRSSFKAKEEMAWGQTIPEYIFRHFVLPIRVNNEDLDESRIVFYDELKDRIKNLSLTEAVLEVNHWCHERVVYTPSDARTISPLACVKAAMGRCGEESTFTVAALRSVGIPARQVYTPRWAHTDSNHAWVEAWVDGEWHFFGACEPEPVLNLGWFNGPAYRAMLLHTRVFGKYNGPEEIMSTTANFTEINLLESYAPTAKGKVTIVDASNKPIKDANVEFKIYNYADFYTVSTKKTDEQGTCSITAGKGDLFVWASKDGKVGCGKLTLNSEEGLTIVLDKRPNELVAFDMDITPPVDGTIPAEITEEQKQENAKRLVEEDLIRNKYVSTFYTEAKAKDLAKKLNLKDETLVIDYITTSRGNWKEIEQFLLETQSEKRETALALLGVISKKDLQDISASILKAHLDESIGQESPLYVEYILNPRVLTELLTPYKQALRNQFDADFIAQAQHNPAILVNWCNTELTMIDENNPQRIMASPLGVMKSRVCDIDSKNIFFVSLCRSLGIAARLEPATRKVQYFKDKWNDVDFTDKVQGNAKQGWVTATYNSTKILPDPAYNNHYSISKIANGTLQSLNYRGEKGQWSMLLKNPQLMDEGNYMLTTGTRMANGSILVHLDFFTIEEGKVSNTKLIMRESKDDIQVIGSIDAEALYTPVGESTPQSILSTTGRGYFIIGILSSRQEPTNHALKDIALVAKEFETWGRSMILLFPNEQNYKNFDANEFKGLPNVITYGIDVDNNITSMLVKAMNLPNANSLPIFIIADTFGRVVFVSQGYTIGIGEQMMNVIHKL